MEKESLAWAGFERREREREGRERERREGGREAVRQEGKEGGKEKKFKAAWLEFSNLNL